MPEAWGKNLLAKSGHEMEVEINSTRPPGPHLGTDKYSGWWAVKPDGGTYNPEGFLSI